MADNPFDALERLAELLSDKAATIGLEQITFQPIIDKRTGQRFIQAMFILEAPLSNTPEPEIETSGDPELDAILSGIAEATAEDEAKRQEEERQALHDLAKVQEDERLEEMRQRALRMKDRLRDPNNGILDDD